LLVKAQWIKREPVRQKIILDVENAVSPPPGTKWIESVSVNASQSGMTLERVEKQTEDGFPVEERRIVYGFRFSSAERGIVTPAKSVTNFDGVSYYNDMEYDVIRVWGPSVWRVIEDVTTTYTYDEYGYLLKAVKVGYRWIRAREETEALEAYSLASLLAEGSATQGDIAELNLYKFMKVPVRGESQYLYRRFKDYYKDAQEEPFGEVRSVCNPDGTSSKYVLINKGWAPSVFLAETLEYESCYRSLPNPENFDLLAGDVFTGDISCGKESQSRTRIQILPSSKTKSNSFEFSGTFSVETTDGQSKTLEDRYLVYSSNDIAMNGSFNDKAVDVQIQTQEGRPQPAQRKPPLFTLVDPSQEGDGSQRDRVVSPSPSPKKQESESTDETDPLTKGKDSSKDEFFYTLTTAGYKPTDPVRGSRKWEGCDDIASVMWAAKIDLEIEDLQRSARITISVPYNKKIRPMDRISVMTTGDLPPLKVVSLRQRVVIEGAGVFRASPTEITCGVDRTIGFDLHQVTSTSPAKTEEGASDKRYQYRAENGQDGVDKAGSGQGGVEDGDSDPLLTVNSYGAGGGKTIGEIKPPNLRSRYNVNGDT